MSFCIRNAEGQYLTHNVDVVKGTSSLWFTPSPWIAYTFPDREMAEMVAVAPDVQGSVEEWERPKEVARMR